MHVGEGFPSMPIIPMGSTTMTLTCDLAPHRSTTAYSDAYDTAQEGGGEARDRTYVPGTVTY